MAMAGIGDAATALHLTFVLLPATSVAAEPDGGNCCAMKREELEALAGFSPDCPKGTQTRTLSDKCLDCPTGTCKINSGFVGCYCPSAFLESYDRGVTGTLGWSNHCVDAYGDVWPDSVGKENIYERSCTKGDSGAVEEAVVPVVAGGDTNCCAMKREELEALAGFIPDCPKVTQTRTLSDKCLDCPIGTCKINSGYVGCYCPSAFLESYDRGVTGTLGWSNHCDDAYGAAWPASVGKENIYERSCRKGDDDQDGSATVGSETCDLVCANGGEVKMGTCTCRCQSGWTGPTCDECDGDMYCSGHGTCDAAQECSCATSWFGPKCDVYCKSSETCSANGECSESGACVCSGETTGPNCECDEFECEGAAAAGEQTCSGQGVCSEGACACRSGFYGCSCEHSCTRSANCSGRGECKQDGSCDCDRGFVGPTCSEQDPEKYCAGETISGHPCLLGLEDNLGYGFNIITGEKTKRVLQLQYTEGRLFTHNLLGTFEIPDNVDCIELPISKDSGYLKTFTGSLQYRLALSSEVGASAFFKKGYFSGSAESKYATDFLFQKQQLMSEKLQVHRHYSCTIRTFQPIFTSQVMQKNAQLSGQQLVESLGTHVIERADFGGFIRVRALMSSCVLATLTTAQIEAELNIAFAEIATGGSFMSSCDIINSNGAFEREVGGGEKSTLLVADPTDPAFEKEWIESIRLAPAATNKLLYKLGDLLLDLWESIDSFEDSYDTLEEWTIDPEPDTCASVKSGISTCVDLIAGRNGASYLLPIPGIVIIMVLSIFSVLALL